MKVIQVHAQQAALHKFNTKYGYIDVGDGCWTRRFIGEFFGMLLLDRPSPPQIGED